MLGSTDRSSKFFNAVFSFQICFLFSNMKFSNFSIFQVHFSTSGIRVVGKGSWKNEKLESPIRNWKNEVGKFAMKMVSSCRSWKVWPEVGKYN